MPVSAPKGLTMALNEMVVSHLVSGLVIFTE